MIALSLYGGNKLHFRASRFTQILVIAMQEARLANKKIGLSINFVSKAKIRALNLKYRNKGEATDILSFNLGKREFGAIMELGDIFICLSVAQHMAENEGISLKEKIKFLTIHGFLHLIGYDHEKLKDQKKMFGLQDKILKKCVKI